eukprot:8136139-Ditylum_brightwellii.AAC.1
MFSEEKDDLTTANQRKYPRSRMQKLVDDAEDSPDNSSLLLDLSNLGAPRVSSRIYDLGTKLISLNLSGNKLSRISPDIADLHGLTTLDISRNNIEKLPSELDELTNLK